MAIAEHRRREKRGLCYVLFLVYISSRERSITIWAVVEDGEKQRLTWFKIRSCVAMESFLKYKSFESMGFVTVSKALY